MPNIKEIYEKVRTGDPLTDDELKIGVAHFSKAAELLAPLGPRFDFAENELRRVATILQDYTNARKRMRTLKQKRTEFEKSNDAM